MSRSPRPAPRGRLLVLLTCIAMSGGLAAGVPAVAATGPADQVRTAPSAPPSTARHGSHHQTHHRAHGLSISVLSGRADLVSGGSALVSVHVPRHVPVKRLRISVGRHDKTRGFVLKKHRDLLGLVRGLRLGRNVLRATLPSGKGVKITLVDHPSSGPMISGPQLHPWVCQAGAVDKQCDEPSTYAYQYKSSVTGAAGLQAYDPKNPPSDVARVTVNGVTVPFIVRTETGYLDRDQYSVTVLWQPGKKWTPTKPQPQFTHKMLVTHGSSCGDDRTTGTAPVTNGMEGTGGNAPVYALGRGFVVMSTALDNSGHNCNIALQAESLIMAKEHVIKTLGTLDYTIGTGCSGGSLAEQWVANAYPGFYQGILPTCSFPDAYSTATQFLDYHLLLSYFTDPTRWDAASGVAWTPTQMGDVLGGPDGVANAEVSEQAQFHVAVPTDTCAGVTAAQRYEPTTNPGGVRCTIQDAAINVFGPEEKRFWTTAEKKIGHGFVRLPVDNVGVEYGLKPLLAGTITPADFVDLNAKIGGVDVNTAQTPGRLDNGDSASLRNAYRSGMINTATHLNQVPIIDCRGTNPGLFHDVYRAFAVRARLQAAHGTHANQVIWEGPAPLIGDADCEHNSFVAMNSWLSAIQHDHRSGSLPAKVIRDKPAAVTDRCYDGSGQLLTSQLCPQAVVTVEATPRMEAGDAITTDANKCRLKPLARSDFASLLVPFTDAQWTQLQQLYPGGVCDYSKPGVGQRGAIPWLTYQNAKGKVIYGGRPLGKAPVSVPLHAKR